MKKPLVKRVLESHDVKINKFQKFLLQSVLIGEKQTAGAVKNVVERDSSSK